MTLEQQIEAFLAGSPHAVVGASKDRQKYGNKVLRVYLQRQRNVYLLRFHRKRDMRVQRDWFRLR